MSCDSFFWLLVWMRWLEYAHLGCPMADGDFVFPAIGANGAVYPGEPISHDKIQKYINEATAGSGIEGNFTMHCFRRGGAQYRFIQAHGEEKWDRPPEAPPYVWPLQPPWMTLKSAIFWGSNPQFRPNMSHVTV